MKQSKHQIEQRIEEILNYLLSHNMAEMDRKELSAIASRFHVLNTMLENMNKSYSVKSYGMDDYIIMT